MRALRQTVESDADLARILSRNRSVITRTFMGTTRPSRQTAIRVARARGVSTADLLSGATFGPDSEEAPVPWGGSSPDGGAWAVREVQALGARQAEPVGEALDGAATAIWRTDGTLRGVIVPWGRHTIDLTYQPRRVLAGTIISILSGLACAGAVWIQRRRAG